jgi:hypothetical protein
LDSFAVNAIAGRAPERIVSRWPLWTRVSVLTLAGLVALGLGLAVYVADRDGSGAALVPVVAAMAGVGWFGAAGAWLPTFTHTLAFSLFSAAALPARSPWPVFACAGWCAVNVAFEMGQHPALQRPLADALIATGGANAEVRLLARYFSLGRFDPLDIVAAIGGALAAGAFIALLDRCLGERHAH